MAKNVDATTSTWRVKYPWIIIVYIFVFGILVGLLRKSASDLSFALNVLLIAGFTSYVFLYIFYIYGVRPIELEHKFKK